MNKIFKNPTEKTKRQLNRFIVIPLQKPLAKFLISDFNFLLDWISNEEYEKFKKLIFEGGRNDFRKLRRNKPRLNKIYDSLEEVQVHIINLLFRYFLNGYRLKEITSRDDYSATYYTNRTNLSDNLTYFVKKGYTLVKFNFPVIEKPKNKFLSTPEIYKEQILLANDIGLMKLVEVLSRIIENEKTVKSGIDIIYSILGLTEKELKKTTFRRKYFSYKKAPSGSPDIFPKNYDRNLYDSKVFNIKQLHENGKSQSAIAQKFNISRGKVKKICDDPIVARFYTDATRFTENYFDYFLINNRTF